VKTAHCHLNDRELEALDRLADELGHSRSGVLRIALRYFAGLPVASGLLELRHRAIALDPSADETVAAAS